MPAIAYATQLLPAKNPHMEKDGTPSYPFINHLRQIFNRTGGGTGIVNKVNQTVTASGNSQETATQLTHDWHMITDGQGGVTMQSIKPGQDLTVFNNSGQDQHIYPFSGAQIDALGENAPFTIPHGKAVTIQCYTTTVPASDVAAGSPAQLKSFLSN